MFSANENLALRQHKRRIVSRVEATMPEDALDFGTTVMVMQVSCQAPGCVPLETAIIIVFPSSKTELIPGLPESKEGGNYKTKILKPMAEVTDDDILEALPPAFEGGRRTMEKLCTYARDVMLAQITQLFGDETDESSVKDRRAMADFLQSCLQEYTKRQCQPPEVGEAWLEEEAELVDEKKTDASEDDQRRNQDESTEAKLTTTTTTTTTTAFPKKGNIVIRRPQQPPNTTPTTEVDQSKFDKSQTKSSSVPLEQRSSVFTGPPKHQRALREAIHPSTRNSISQLFNREHAPGVRQAGCPCCDPSNPSNAIDTMMI